MSDERQERKDVVLKRACWRLMMSKLVAAHLLHRMVWVDETALWTRMPRRYGRAPRGRRARGRSRFGSTRYTLIAAMSAHKVVVSQLIQGGAKLQDFEDFMEQLRAELEPGSILQWDNLKAHHNKKLLKALRKQGVRVIHQPPYSPESNPIEEMFSTLKTLIRGQVLKGIRELRAALALALTKITRAHRDSWIAHALEKVAEYPELAHLYC